MQINPRELLTTREFGKLIGVTDQTVRKWIADSKIESYRVGGVLKIHPDQVDAIVQKQARN
ncbi:excisionase family DNA-binding protein [Rhodococcoides fascians]|uniref:excisionase family DNA-binding protein n=1 Tax=Rhodococcoides fascians TaxID=1828 RepID=UPI00056D3C0D